MKTVTLLLTLSALSFLPTTLSAQTFLDTLGENDEFVWWMGAVVGKSSIGGTIDQEVGIPFQVELPGVNYLESVEAPILWIKNGGSPNRAVRMDLWSQTEFGLPDQVIESATVSEFPEWNSSNSELTKFQFSGETGLEFGESYILTAKLLGVDKNLEEDNQFWALSEVRNDLIYRDEGIDWSRDSDVFNGTRGLALRINAVPEPGTASTVAMLLAIFFSPRRRTTSTST